MAIFKLLDLFNYVSLSIMNPSIGWVSGMTNSQLYLGYSLQTYVAAAIAAVSVPLGIRGIMLIFEDRLGLTETRMPASFPHPMFIFTFLYKLLILSLFGIITKTFLATFNCDWTATNSIYTLVADSSI